MKPSPVFQVSGSTYRLISEIERPGTYARSAAAAVSAAPLLTDLGSPSVHWVDGRHYLADGRWREWTLRRSAEALRQLATARRHDTCIVVGNGPSLKHTDLSLLSGQDVFLANYAILDPTLKAGAKFLSVVNPHVAEQEAERFNELTGLTRFYPYWLRYCLEESAETFFLNEFGGEPFFSTNITENISGHSTVTHFNLQIAYYLGYRKVVLIGCDNLYQQPKGVKEGDVVTCDGDDPNHFRPDYFRGKKWQAADTSRMSLVYQLAKTAFEEAGREIVNCTVGGQLEVFRRGDLAAELALQPDLPKIAQSLNCKQADAQHATNHDSLGWFKGRHANEECYLAFDAPPLHSKAALTKERIVISVDQKDLGVETLSVYPRYLFVTNPSLMRNLAPDIRLLRCVKLLLESPAAWLAFKEDALTHIVPLRLLHEAVGAAPEAKCSKQVLALGLAAHLGFRTIGLPSTVKDELPTSVVSHLSRGGIALSFV